MPDPGGQWPPRSISLRFLFLLKLCSLLEKVETRDALGLRVWLLGGNIAPLELAPYLLNPFQEYERRRHQAWTSSLELRGN